MGGDRLSSLVQETFGRDPFSGAVFVFRSKRADRIRLAASGKFVWPGIRDGVMRLSLAQFAALLEGLIGDCSA
jgi:transposase